MPASAATIADFDYAVAPPVVRGATGATGQQGLRGFQGLRGHQGSTGATGARGNTGAAGPEGDVGPEGSAPVYIYQEGPEGVPPARPVGGTYDTDTGVLVVPAGWSADPSTPGAGIELYFSITIVHHTHVGVVVPVWSEVGLSGGQGPPGSTGSTGPRGHAGTPGTHGSDGADGAAGAKGDQGDQGIRGFPGPVGPPVNTADLVLEEIGLSAPALTLPGDRSWVATGVFVPDGVHMILLDASTATDDFHVIDWDTVISDDAAVVGTVSQPNEYETFVLNQVVNTLVRIGHDAAGQILLANDSTAAFNIPQLRVERLLGPPGPPGPPGTGGGGGGLTYAAIQGLPLHQPGIQDQFPFARISSTDVAASTGAAIGSMVRGILDDQDRILPQGALDHQIAIWDPVTNAWITSYLPPRVPEHVSEFPDHTLAASTELVFLDQDISAGQAQDGTLTVGFGLSSEFEQHPLAGYDAFEHTGAINPGAPSVLSILGSATGTVDFNGRNVLLAGHTFSLQYIRFPSQASADKWSHFRVEGSEYPLLPTIRQGSLYYRNVGNYPDDLGYAAGQVLGDVIQLDWNLRTESGVYLLQGAGSIQLSPRGFYGKQSTGYSRFASTGYHYTHGTGVPVGKPRHPDEWFRNEFGDLYVAAGFPRLRDEIVNSAGTILSLDGNTDDYSNHALYARNPVAGWAQLSPEGAIRWNYDTHTTGLNIFRQRRDGVEYPERVTWVEWTTYLVDVLDNATTRRIHDHSHLLGVFTAHADAFDYLDEQITQQEFDSLATDYYYLIASSDTSFNADPKGGIYKVTAFSASHLVYDDSDLHWDGPVWNRERFSTWLHNNPATVVTELKLGGYSAPPLPDQPDPDDAADTSDDSGKVWTVQDDGTTALETPSGGGGGGDGVVTGGVIAGTTLTLARSQGLGDIHIPGLPSGGGGETRTVIYEDTSVGLNNTYGARGVPVPTTGDIEIFLRGITAASRKGNASSARIPASVLTGATAASGGNIPNNADSLNHTALPFGANRYAVIATDASNMLLLGCQAAGNFFVRVTHIA